MAENIRPYIIINEKNSMEVSGLLITKLPPITKPQMRVTAEEIDGRDGDIVTELGFSAYDKEIEIGLVGDYDVNDVIEYFNQSGIITFSNEPDKYYKFAQYDGIDFDKLIRFKKAKVSFHVQPFKFETDENDDVIYAPTSFNVTNEGNIYSRPEIALQGSGNVGIVLNGSQALSINLGDTKQAIVIDSNDMNAYGTKINIKELITEINPVQDLHGYNQPWIGGGGKNKLEPCITSGTVNGITYTVNDDGTIKLSNTATSESKKWGFFELKAGSYIYTSGVTESLDTYDTYLSIGDTTIARGISGNNSFTLAQDSTIGLTIRVRNGITPNITIKPMIRLSGTSSDFEPYENICNISGWNGCVITRCGTNIWDGDFESGKFNISTGAEVSDSNFIRSKNFIKVKPDTVGYVKFDNPQFIALFYDENKTYTTHYSALGSGGGYISIPSDAHYMKFYSQESTNQNDISINYPTETDEDYHAYVGSKYQTYFEGLMAGTYGFVDLGSLEWSYITSGAVNRFQAPLTISGAGCADNTKIANMICSGFGVSSWSNVTNLSSYDEYIAEVSGGGYITVQDSSFTDAEAFTEAMSGKYLIYELATSTTPTITQEQINMLISAFNADLVCVVFGQEVYGGSLNVTTGLLTLTHGIKTFDGTLSYTMTGDGKIVYCDATPDAKVIEGNYGQTTAICDHFRNETNSVAIRQGTVDMSFNIGSAYFSTTPRTVFRNSNWASVSDAINFFSDNPTQIVYELKTPTTVQLTAQDVMTLIGKNNIMSNTGAISELIYTHAGADVTTSGDIVSFDVDVGDIKDNILKNRLVTGNYDNLRLKIGTNQLGVSGDVDVIVLSNFSRWL